MAKKQASRPTEKEREERIKKRADGFFGAFLFTENGKPKSSLMVYTFCLSFVFLFVYVMCYEGAMRLLTAPLASLASWASNLFIALCASGVGAAVCCVPHRFFKDKRLVFGGHLWLLLYAVMVLATMVIMMGGDEATGTFMVFFGWFIAIPVAVGCVVSGILYRRDWHPEPEKQEEPEWKRYVNRR